MSQRGQWLRLRSSVPWFLGTRGAGCPSHLVTVLSRDAVCSGLLISGIPSGTNKTPGTKTRLQGMSE